MKEIFLFGFHVIMSVAVLLIGMVSAFSILYAIFFIVMGMGQLIKDLFFRKNK